MAFYTNAGNDYAERVTVWLQNTRLMSESVFRLYSEYQKSGQVKFSDYSWPKGKKGLLSPNTFTIKPVVLSHRMDSLLKNLWKSQFIFLESLWEEYLQDLVLELGDADKRILEPFCDREFMFDVMRDLISDKFTDLSEVHQAAAERFAAGLTRVDWNRQWKQLKQLNIGLSPEDAEHDWYGNLDVYFEMRNCIIHRGARISPLLKAKSPFYEKSDNPEIEIFPGHLDFYRGNFIDCLKFIEGKIKAKRESKA